MARQAEMVLVESLGVGRWGREGVGVGVGVLEIGPEEERRV